MALVGQLPEAKVGESLKVWLPGESPWAECTAIYPDGSWDGRINNKLIAEYSDTERARFFKDSFGTTRSPPKLHDFKQGQVVRFARQIEDEIELWVPAPRAC